MKKLFAIWMMLLALAGSAALFGRPGAAGQDEMKRDEMKKDEMKKDEMKQDNTSGKKAKKQKKHAKKGEMKDEMKDEMKHDDMKQ